MKQLCSMILITLFVLTPVFSQAPQSNWKATEKVIIQYEQLVAAGAFLTPEGWEKARKIFDRSGPFPRDGKIFIMTTGGSLGKNWVKENQAQVETKWTDYLGAIDSSLRYEGPKTSLHFAMTAYVFRLVYTNKRTVLATDGKTIREITGAWG